jgi:hypothetical protein
MLVRTLPRSDSLFSAFASRRMLVSVSVSVFLSLSWSVFVSVSASLSVSVSVLVSVTWSVESRVRVYFTKITGSLVNTAAARRRNVPLFQCRHIAPPVVVSSKTKHSTKSAAGPIVLARGGTCPSRPLSRPC